MFSVGPYILSPGNPAGMGWRLVAGRPPNRLGYAIPVSFRCSLYSFSFDSFNPVKVVHALCLHLVSFISDSQP